MITPIDNTFSRLTVLWLASLVSIAVLSLSSDLLLNNAVIRSESYATIVNTAGRQHKLIQQLALDSTLYVYAASAGERAEYGAKITDSLAMIQDEHSKLKSIAQNNSTLQTIYESADSISVLNETYWRTISDFIALPEEEISSNSPSYRQIMQDTPVIMSRLENAMNTVLNDGVADTNTLRMINNIRLMVVTAFLTAQFFFVFRPTMSRLRGRANALEREIAERKNVESQLRASEIRLRSLAETAPVGIFQAAPDGSMKWVNNRWREIMHLPGDKAFGLAWTAIVHREDLPYVLTEIEVQRVANNPFVMFDYRILRQDGTVVFIHATSTPERDINGNVIGSIGTIMDITQRKLAEEHAIKLEAERQRMRVLGEFIRDTSHDLRTPLTVIKSGLYFCRKLTDVDKIHERVIIVEEYVNHLNVVIDQLQDMAVLDTLTAITLLPTSLPSILTDIAHNFSKRPDAADKTLTLDISPDLPTVRAAADKLRDALKVVLDNAWRYTASDGKITLKAHAEEGKVIITISDNGIGISPENLLRVFERFYKVDKARTVGGGAGLGLPIAQRIMELHGGTITMDSTLGVGTTVQMTLLNATPHIYPASR